MAQDNKRQKTVVVGAGPVGALAALYAAQRGHDVEIYELRGDLRDPATIPLNFTKSINLALSERGINAIKQLNQEALLESIMSETLPMRGRMIHGKDSSGNYYETPQDYDIHGRAIYAVDRGGLNKRLLDELESLDNVKFFFNHKLTGADFKNHRAWFESLSNKVTNSVSDNRGVEIEIDFDFLIGADGAHSATRYHLMKFTRMNYQQEYIDTLWCEFEILPNETSGDDNPSAQFRISPNHLHIWPGKDFMFIAIPSQGGSFVCTLFMPAAYYAKLEAAPDSIPSFFDTHFPGVTNFITPEALISSFTSNPHLPLISIKCQPYHYADSVVIVGDAAHAMVPFYGQGMNAGMEDVRVLFSFLDKKEPRDNSVDTIDPKVIKRKRAEALAEYSAFRTTDLYTINELALQNYIEMRSSVTSPVYKLRKKLEELASFYFPSFDWQTQYSRVSFSNQRYSEVTRKTERQGKILLTAFSGLVASPLILGACLLFYRWKRAPESLLEVAKRITHG
ncbi:hypothetical protein F5884DRAFT_775985 [Xylogone sp. PMI_703]|nr:hypothetical protein F5884DRAFT_775985 [Xylogone sp. PMI_703]